jgi:hypothetical protein
MVSQKEQLLIGDEELLETCQILLSALGIFERKVHELGVVLSISETIRPEADFIARLAMPSDDGNTATKFAFDFVGLDLIGLDFYVSKI